MSGSHETSRLGRRTLSHEEENPAPAKLVPHSGDRSESRGYNCVIYVKKGEERLSLLSTDREDRKKCADWKMQQQNLSETQRRGDVARGKRAERQGWAGGKPQEQEGNGTEARGARRVPRAEAGRGAGES